MDKPTESARSRFELADQSAKRALQFLGKTDKLTDEQRGHYFHASAVALIAQGLSDLAIGLRATYILLEQVKTLLERPSK